MFQVMPDSKTKEYTMKSQETLMKPKSEGVVHHARRGVLSTPGKLMLAAATLAAMLVFTWLSVFSRKGPRFFKTIPP
jgi:hypothetical protein